MTLDLAGLHVDKPGYRPSLACTVMEAARPDVDRWLLEYLSRRTFALREVVEARDGQVTLMPSITHELMATLPLWREAIRPTVQAVVDVLLATPLPATLPAPQSPESPRAAAANVLPAAMPAFKGTPPGAKSLESAHSNR